jgi:hypothetical protein
MNGVEPDWTFALKNLGGPFVFRLDGLPEDWMVASVKLGEKDITDTPWDVPTGGKTFEPLTITITQRIGRLSGTVTNDEGKAVTDATVVLFPEDDNLWMVDSRFIRTARPDRNGRFSVAGLPAGNYLAIAREFVDDGQWFDRRFLESVRDAAARLSIAEGGSTHIVLRPTR